jgi:hypothetical protein
MLALVWIRRREFLLAAQDKLDEETVQQRGYENSSASQDIKLLVNKRQHARAFRRSARTKDDI